MQGKACVGLWSVVRSVLGLCASASGPVRAEGANIVQCGGRRGVPNDLWHVMSCVVLVYVSWVRGVRGDCFEIRW